MDVGLKTKVSRSARLMDFVVSGVVKTKEGRKEGQSLLHPLPKPSTRENMSDGNTS
jgi:hypothetical protein